MQPHLFLERKTLQIVSSRRAAGFIRQEFRRQKERDSPAACRCVRQPGQHHMDDVVGKVVFSPADIDFLPEKPVSVAIRLGPAGQGADVGAGLGLGHGHRAGPFPRHKLRQIDGLLYRIAVFCQKRCRAFGQRRAQGKRHVGAVPYFRQGTADEAGQTLSAMGGVGCRSAPSCLAKSGPGIGKARRGRDRAAFQSAPDRVSGPIERGEPFCCETRSMVQKVVDLIAVKSLKGGQEAKGIEPCQPRQDKADIVERRVVRRHRRLTVPCPDS